MTRDVPWLYVKTLLESLSIELLQDKSLLANKMQKITCFSVIKVTDADSLSLFKVFLHNCGRARILSKQLKKMSRIVKCCRKSQKVKKTHGKFSCLKCINIRNTVTEIEMRLRRNKTKPSFQPSSSAFRQNLFYFIARKLANK